MKKNVKKAVVRVAGIVGLAVVCMAAYYGLRMFALQNDMKLLNPMGCAAVAAVCASVAMYTAKKEQKKAKEETQA